MQKRTLIHVHTKGIVDGCDKDNSLQRRCCYAAAALLLLCADFVAVLKINSTALRLFDRFVFLRHHTLRSHNTQKLAHTRIHTESPSVAVSKEISCRAAAFVP